MTAYFVNKLDQPDGTHIVHSDGCVFLPISKSLCLPLGIHNSCEDAVLAAEDFYKNVRWCFVCYQKSNKELMASKSEKYESKKA